MPLTFTKGDMWSVSANYRINTVNCVGVMGKGVALQFKQRYPNMFRMYQALCRQGTMQPGVIGVHKEGHEVVLNFPTKRHWRDGSRIEDIELGLKKLALFVSTANVDEDTIITMPPLGCGNGGLDWSDVEPLIQRYLADCKPTIIVFEP